MSGSDSANRFRFVTPKKANSSPRTDRVVAQQGTYGAAQPSVAVEPFTSGIHLAWSNPTTRTPPASQLSVDP